MTYKEKTTASQTSTDPNGEEDDEPDLSDLFNEQNRINKEGKKTGEKQPIKVNPEVDEAEFLRNMAEFDRQKREKTKAIGFEFAELEELEKAERPQIAVPQKVT